jgi:hypothetical protein
MQQKNSCMQYLVQHHRITCATSTNPRRFCDVVLFFAKLFFSMSWPLKSQTKTITINHVKNQNQPAFLDSLSTMLLPKRVTKRKNKHLRRLFGLRLDK